MPHRNNNFWRQPVLPVAILLMAFSAGRSTLHSQTVPRITGGPSLSPRVVASLDTLQSRDSLRRVILTWYSSHGFFDASLTFGADSTIEIDEGRRYLVDSVLVRQPGGFLEFIHRSLGRGEGYSDSLLASIASEILNRLEQRGYPLGVVTVGELSTDRESGTVRPSLVVEPGDRIRVVEYSFVGATNTSDSYLRRASGLRKGEWYDPVTIDRARARLYRTGLFDRVPPPDIRIGDSGLVELVFNLSPRSVNSFDGAIGYQPSSQVQTGGFFTGSVDVGLRNVFGGGESIRGAWSRTDETTSDLSLGFAQPYVFGLPFGIDLSFAQVVEDESPLYTSWVERRLRGVATVEIGGDWKVEAGGTYSSLIASPDTVGGPCSGRQLPGSNSLGGTIGIRYDSRDFPLNPRSGALYRSEFGFGRREVEEGSGECAPDGNGALSLSRQSLAAELLVARALAGPFVAVGHVQGMVLAGEEFDISELYRVGGTNTVRGYREGAFRGTRVGAATIESRVILSEYSHAGLFVDAGYVFLPILRLSTAEASEEFLLGYGALFQVDTPAGVARFSVGLARGASVDDATISVGLVGSF